MLTDSAAPSPALSTEREPSTPRRSPMLDWVAFALFLMVTARLAVRASESVTDPDTWWHLRLGEEFTSGSWSLADPGRLSPFATRPWFATQWTLEVVAHYVYDGFGLAGVSWLAGLGLVALAAVVYAVCRMRSSMFVAAVVSSVTLFATILSHGPRPQLASFIFVAIVTSAWLRTMRDLKPRWWLVPLSWLWACTHGMWFMGVLVGVVVVVGLLLDGRLDRGQAVRLGLVPVGGIVAAAVTPVGPKLILAPLATSKMAQFITEWQPPKFSEPVPAIALLMVAVVVITWARAGTRRSWAEILLIAMALGWIVLYYRTIAVGAVIAAPLVASSIQSWLPTEALGLRKWEPRVGIAFALAIVVGLGIAAPYRNAAPLEGVDRLNAALSRLPTGTVVYNDYGLGGWLEWKHRNVAPVVDGLTDAYEFKYVDSYMKTKDLESGWQERIDKTGAEYALLESETPLAAALKDEHWNTVVRESKYVLLQRPSR